LPAGSVAAFAGPALPTGWIECDGAAISRTTFAALFAALGVAWGPGDGVTTFNVPDLRSCTIVGVGQKPTFSLRNLADQGGEETHQLVIGEMPGHNHTLTDPGHSHTVPGWTATADSVQNPGALTYEAQNPATSTTDTTGITLAAIGGDGAHENMQPWAALRYMIKT
jgi:microcystin-dependent protein